LQFTFPERIIGSKISASLSTLKNWATDTLYIYSRKQLPTNKGRKIGERQTHTGCTRLKNIEIFRRYTTREVVLFIVRNCRCIERRISINIKHIHKYFEKKDTRYKKNKTTNAWFLVKKRNKSDEVDPWKWLNFLKEFLSFFFSFCVDFFKSLFNSKERKQAPNLHKELQIVCAFLLKRAS
jgi:hypothetical protein